MALPWFGLLTLLLLKVNRSPQAWWIWLPTVCLLGLGLVLSRTLAFIPSEPLDLLNQMFVALALGIAAVWLTSPYLVRHSRFRTLLGMLLSLAAFSLLAGAVQLDWTAELSLNAVFLAFLAVFVVVMMVALGLAGFTCRRSFRPMRFALCLLGCSLASWIALASPWLAFAWIMSDGNVSWLETLASLLVLSGVSYGTLLPFLVLSFANPLFRERLKQVLHLPEASHASAPTLAGVSEAALN